MNKTSAQGFNNNSHQGCFKSLLHLRNNNCVLIHVCAHRNPLGTLKWPSATTKRTSNWQLHIGAMSDLVCYPRVLGCRSWCWMSLRSSVIIKQNSTQFNSGPIITSVNRILFLNPIYSLSKSFCVHISPSHNITLLHDVAAGALLLLQKNTIHQVTTMLATSNILLGDNQSAGSSVPVVSRWLWPGNRMLL